MAEAVPAVALLFDDAGLGQQLRDALEERGARIVHEGPLVALSRQLLASVEADVLVVNLDDDDDSALDRLDEALEGERPRVVFNDAQASRKLEGWDRARWARHLAMKVLAVGDADPPRPMVAVQAAVTAQAEAEAGAAELTESELETPVTPQIDEEARQAAVSETLAAELEALLASDTPVDEANEFGNGLNYAAGEGALLHEGHFEDIVQAPIAAMVANDQPGDTPVMPVDEPVALDSLRSASTAPAAEEQVTTSFRLDQLELAPIDAGAVPQATLVAAEPAVAPLAPDSWTLADPDAPSPSPSQSDTVAERVDPTDFGIEKLSAAEFLAPDGESGDESPVVPGMSLELVSIEEAIAPQHFEPTHEPVPDPPANALQRLVVLGATTESTAAVGEFLAALPPGLHATVLHTQHLAGRPADGLVEYFASQCALPVRLAEPGMRANVGEVIVVPSDRQVALHRDGTVQLQPIEERAAHVPSIDVSFTQAAGAFGRDVVAIVFAGRSTDAVGGCQAVHDRGGQVWVEASGGSHPADMVSGVLAERLSHHAGPPRELAARLAEQFTEGQP